ncbi:CHRD domain-containing protein [Telluribacter humicola]
MATCLLFLATGCDNDDDDVTPEESYLAILSGATTVPTNNTSATGTTDAIYNSESNQLRLMVTYERINPTAWHIHRAEFGEKGPVVFDLGTNFMSPYETTITLTEEQEEKLDDGMYYIDIHSAEYPDGEIRGQLTDNEADDD